MSDRPPSGTNVFEAVLVRLFAGGAAWLLVCGVLFVLVALGGGFDSGVPGFLFVIWTLAVAFWILAPIGSLGRRAQVKCIVFVLSLLALLWVAMEWDSWAREFEFKRNLAPHAEYFAGACKKATTRIFRKEQGVDSVAFEGVRESQTAPNLADPNFRGDVYSGFDTSYAPAETLAVTVLLKGFRQVEVRTKKEDLAGFARYRPAAGPGPNLPEHVAKPASRFLIRIEDISTAEDRRHWVAGSKWTVVDISTGEILADSVAYAMDPHVGRTRFPGPHGNAGEPWAPWRRAGHVQYRLYGVENACPPKDKYQVQNHNVDFVRTVLGP